MTIKAGDIQYERESQIPNGVPYISEARSESAICLLCYAQGKSDCMGEYPVFMQVKSGVMRVTSTYCLEHAQKLLPTIQALCNEPPQQKTRKKKSK